LKPLEAAESTFILFVLAGAVMPVQFGHRMYITVTLATAPPFLTLAAAINATQVVTHL
jgi:hypothetical protein